VAVPETCPKVVERNPNIIMAVANIFFIVMGVFVKIFC